MNHDSQNFISIPIKTDRIVNDKILIKSLGNSLDVTNKHFGNKRDGRDIKEIKACLTYKDHQQVTSKPIFIRKIGKISNFNFMSFLRSNRR